MDKKNIDINNYLKTRTKKLSDLIEIGIKVSKAAAGHNAGIQKVFGTVLFTRLCNISVTIHRLLPNNSNSRTIRENWDSSSAVSLTRNIIECYHTYFYLCIEKIPDEQSICRKLVFDLHDLKERERMFVEWQDFDKEAPENASEHIALIIGALENNNYFQSFTPKQKSKMLEGKEAFIISRVEIEERIGNNISHYKGLYKFFSQHTHSFPMSFYRMLDQDRGRGVENDVDKSYLALAADTTAAYLQSAINDMIGLFPDSCDGLTPRQHNLLANIEDPVKEWGNNPELLQKLAGYAEKLYTWKQDTDGIKNGVQLYLDVEYQSKDTKKSEWLTICISKRCGKMRPEAISFILPSNVDQKHGLFISFAHQTNIDGHFGVDIDKEASYRIAFDSETDDTIAVRCRNGSATDIESKQEVDILQKMLNHQQFVLLCVLKSGDVQTIMVPLFSFQEQYVNLT